MKMLEIWNKLKEQGCVAFYRTGSSCVPYISNPRDEEYVAVFNSLDEQLKAEKIHNVHYYHKPELNKKDKKLTIGDYIFHYINNAEHYGEDITFNEYDIKDLKKVRDTIIKRYKNQTKQKVYYYCAMIDAIDKYGYDDIPERVAKQISKIHDLELDYKDFEL